LTKLERKEYTINSPLNEIIIGLLLGDGHIRNRNSSENSRFFFYAQSSLRVNYLNYFNHIFDLFKFYIFKELKIKFRLIFDNRINKFYSFVQFVILILICFIYYRKLFYKFKNKKIVSSNIKQLLTPMGLAY
jgi:hypothetical protein